jgi:DNA-binding CsgD family transcriptional regulator
LRKVRTTPNSETETGTFDWYCEIGEIVDALEDENLPERLVRALGHLAPFEMAAVFVYRGRSRPLPIYDNFSTVDARKGIAAYVENTYVLNPLYQAYQKGLKSGVYRMRDLAPDAFFESEYHKAYRVLPSHGEEIGYLTENWPQGMQELLLVVALDGNALAEITLSRPHDGSGFSQTEISRLGEVVPLVGALFRRYWAEFGDSRFRTPPPDRRVDDAFDDFGKSVLTDREREVTRMILRGHSSESIGFNLGISLGTVKTHRKNVYAKLAISSQSELLSLFLKSLQGP